MSEATRSTVYSLSNELPRPDSSRRSADGELDAGVLEGHGCRRPCFIHRLTSAGATLGLMSPIAEGEQLALELQTGHTIPGTVEWCTGEEAGFRFDETVDVVAALARKLAALPAERRRVPRVEIHQIVSIRHGNKVAFARTRDLSQAGVGVETTMELTEDDAVEVTFDGLRPIDGTVRWAHDRAAGILFGQELGWQELMPWLRRAQQAGPTLPPGQGMLSELIQEDQSFGLSGDARAVRLNLPARVREGVRWYNVQLRALTADLVEFESRSRFEIGVQLWVWLPHIGGWPARISDCSRSRYLCEFRMPLRRHELDMLDEGRRVEG